MIIHHSFLSAVSIEWKEAVVLPPDPYSAFIQASRKRMHHAVDLILECLQSHRLSLLSEFVPPIKTWGWTSASSLVVGISSTFKVVCLPLQQLPRSVNRHAQSVRSIGWPDDAAVGRDVVTDGDG